MDNIDDVSVLDESVNEWLQRTLYGNSVAVDDITLQVIAELRV